MKIIKKTILILCILIFTGSLVGNYVFINSSLGKLINEEKRINKNLDLFAYLSPLSFNPEINIKDSLLTNDSLIILMDMTKDQLLEITDELVSTSGGVNENGHYLNPYGIEFVQTYFYKENHFRSNAINIFGQIIEDYINRSKSLGFDTSIGRAFEYSDKYYERDLIFKNLTVFESVLFIESICSKILIDKYQYIHSKKLETKNKKNETLGQRI